MLKEIEAVRTKLQKKIEERPFATIPHLLYIGLIDKEGVTEENILDEYGLADIEKISLAIEDASAALTEKIENLKDNDEVLEKIREILKKSDIIELSNDVYTIERDGEKLNISQRADHGQRDKKAGQRAKIKIVKIRCRRRHKNAGHRCCQRSHTHNRIFLHKAQ